MNLKDIIFKIYALFGVKSFRTKNIVKHITISFFYKAGAVLCNFLLVPLTIDYLDTDNYGVWLTLSSFIAWFSFFDIGLGNGLRNKLTEAQANSNIDLAKTYVSTAYYTVLMVSTALVLLFIILNQFLDWTVVFNTKSELRSDLNLLMPIIVAFFSLQLVVSLITSVYLAHQNHSIQVKIHFLTQLSSLILIWAMTKTSEGSLLLFGIIFSGLPVLILLMLNIFSFTKEYKDLKPSIAHWSKEHLKDIMGIGLNFFIIQIAGVILFSTDNFIISKLFSPQEVVPYNISFKYFSIVTMIYSLVVAPYWSSFTEAYVGKEYEWIRKSIRNVMKIWLAVPIAIFIMVLVSGKFYELWIGDKVSIPMTLTISMAFFVMIFTFNVIFVYFINGTGKIKVQLFLSIGMAILNIPLSVIFSENLNFGVKGVILATIVCYIPGIVIMPLQYYKIINRRAVGIWNC
ncbi:oligosaccharide flippase family protein [Subsaxibacter sp. CAU 1640]|uniref:lipopolysaccharide biosynthesis protein n=1 Tax=Subsaxibacter sp. CAU 1640 TaxID=2933271 RepID=UPI0020040659|nr:oligosaccharide flippase family protein [Subsaxibacter sp. CAU 1640]MCK7589525.1 oligosaccharide flippase family protein [Subsaxibacter sp. CAU 1640]